MGLPLENLPSRDGPFALDEARSCLRQAVQTIEPEGELAAAWPEFASGIISWLDGEAVEFPQVHYYRVGLESMAADDAAGDYLLAAAKLALSAFLLAALNPYSISYGDGDWINDDIDPLVHKAVLCLHEANQEPFDPAVRVDYQAIETVEAAQTHHYFEDIIKRAIRPEAQGGD